MDVIHGPDHRRGGEHANAWNLLQTDRGGMRARHMRELPIDGGHSRLERANFVDDERHGVAEQIGERDLGVLEDARHASEHRAGRRRESAGPARAAARV